MKKKKVKNEIEAFIHCGQCLDSLPVGQSPQDYSRLELGYTKKGVQVWCIRHNRNVIHLDLSAMKK